VNVESVILCDLRQRRDYLPDDTEPTRNPPVDVARLKLRIVNFHILMVNGIVFDISADYLYASIF
jgi:hypothetical protein